VKAADLESSVRGSQDKRSYLSVDELATCTGLSKATIWRLKRAGKIPFFQPAGKCGRVTFPVDAIECAGHAEPSRPEFDAGEASPIERLPGPQPGWMPQTTPKRQSVCRSQ